MADGRCVKMPNFVNAFFMQSLKLLQQNLAG